MTGTTLTQRAVDVLIDEYIDADIYLSRRTETTFATVAAEWRDGNSIRKWRALHSSTRRATVRELVRRIVAPTQEDAEQAERESRPLHGWLVSCACECGEFVPARGPRPVLAFKRGHSPAKRRTTRRA